jgi:hypothetical protein
MPDKIRNIQDSYSQLKALFTRIIQHEDIDLSKYSDIYSEKDREMKVRKRKIDSLLNDDEPDDEI